MLSWRSVVGLVVGCLEEESPPEVLLVLGDTSYRLRAVLEVPADDDVDLLGFVVDKSEGSGSRSLLFVPPERIDRIVIQGRDVAQFGFDAG